jgi:hypothetical protein
LTCQLAAKRINIFSEDCGSGIQQSEPPAHLLSFLRGAAQEVVLASTEGLKISKYGWMTEDGFQVRRKEILFDPPAELESRRKNMTTGAVAAPLAQAATAADVCVCLVCGPWHGQEVANMVVPYSRIVQASYGTRINDSVMCCEFDGPHVIVQLDASTPKSARDGEGRCGEAGQFRFPASKSAAAAGWGALSGRASLFLPGVKGEWPACALGWVCPPCSVSSLLPGRVVGS